MKNKVSLAVLLAGSLAIGACSFHGGAQEHVYPPTLGEELTNLKKAFERGAIDEEEYITLKEELVDSARPSRRNHHR